MQLNIDIQGDRSSVHTLSLSLAKLHRTRSTPGAPASLLTAPAAPCTQDSTFAVPFTDI